MRKSLPSTTERKTEPPSRIPFRRLIELVATLDEEQKRAVEEGLGEEELALFDLLKKDNLGKAERERVKQASREASCNLSGRSYPSLIHFWEKEQTKADVEIFILDKVYSSLPTPPFTAEEKEMVRLVSMLTSGNRL